MAAAYEEFLKKIQEGLAQKVDSPHAEIGGGGQQEGGGVAGGGGGGGMQQTSPTVPPQVEQDLQPQELLATSPTFKALYDNICQGIRSSGTLDTVMKDFQELRTDLERVTYVAQMRQIHQMRLEENYSMKSAEDSNNYEKVYDMLIANEASAGKALEVMKKCVQKTPPEDTTALAVRYMKRGWASLLLEYFDDAETDAKTSLSFTCPEELIWNSYEILGYCSARLHDYKAADTYFHRALENLRKSSVVNEVKATVTVRMMAVFKTVKAKKNKKGPAERPKKKERVPPQVSYGPHKIFPSASSALSFVTVEGKGRCTITKRDIKPGDILMVDSPFCSMINPSFLDSHCLHCYAPCHTPTPCSSCAKVWYCGEECRAASWAATHGTECRVLNHLLDQAIGKLALLSFRILATVTWPELQKLQQYISSLADAEAKSTPEQKGEEEEKEEAAERPFTWEGKYHPRDYRTVLHMASNSSKRTFGDLFKRTITAVYLAHCLRLSGFFGTPDVDENDLNFAASVLLRHLQGSSCNAYEISEMDVSPEGLSRSKLQEVGGALYTTISLTNHACSANATRYSVGDKCVLRAVQPIPRGAEIFDNYGFYYHSSTVNERQEVLLNQYKFQCLCKACSAMWPLYPHHPTEILIFRCPSSGCYSPCCYSTSSRSCCNVCGNQQQYTKLLQDVEQQLKQYKEALTQVKKGNTSSALPTLLSHISFLDRVVVQPVKHYTDVQEVIKQCFNTQGNLLQPRQAAAVVQPVQHAAPKLKPGKKEVLLPH